LKKFPTSLSREDFLVRFGALEEKVGKKYAVDLLSRKAFLSSALAEKLAMAGLSSVAVERAIAFCQEKGFLDDAREIARLIAKEQRKGLGTKALFFKLRAKKGVDPALLKEELQKVAFSDEAILQAWLAKQGKKIDRTNPLEVRKWMARLYRRGFSKDAIFQAFSFR